MKSDLEHLLFSIREGNTNIVMQQEIISKERKIFELERQVRVKDEEIERLKTENRVLKRMNKKGDGEER